MWWRWGRGVFRKYEGGEGEGALGLLGRGLIDVLIHFWLCAVCIVYVILLGEHSVIRLYVGSMSRWHFWLCAVCILYVILLGERSVIHLYVGSISRWQFCIFLMRPRWRCCIFLLVQSRQLLCGQVRVSCLQQY
jgi:hypothetical protein